MQEGLIFANAAVKSREENLFSNDRLMRMLEADTLQDAVKILIEAGYGGGTVPEDPMDFETILSAEAVITDKFVMSDPYADAAVAEITKAAADGKPSPRKIDTAFDRAMFRDIAARLDRRSAPMELKEYFRVYADGLNLASFVRTLGIGGNFTFFEDVFTEGGDISSADFEKAFQEGVSAVPGLVRRTPLAPYADALAAGDVSGFEVARDDYLLGIFRRNKSEMFSVAPVMGYYLAKQNEIRVLRIALVCIKNGVDKQEIRKKLRELYA